MAGARQPRPPPPGGDLSSTRHVLSVAARRLRAEELTDLAERLTGVGTWVAYPEVGEVLWSANLFRVLGLEPDAVAPSMQRVVELTHPHDREALLTFMSAGAGAMVHRVDLPDGSTRHIRATVGARLPAGEDGPACTIGFMQDITEQRQRERHLEAHAAVADALVHWSSVAVSGPALVGGLAEALGCFVGAIYAVRDAALVPVVVWHDGTVKPELLDLIRQVRERDGTSTVEAACERREPVVTDDVLRQAAHPLRDSAERLETRGILGLPVLNRDEVIAVVWLASREQLVLDDASRRTLYGIAHELGDFLGHRRAELEPALLTEREREVLQLAAGGNGTVEIAVELSVSPSTVKTHLDNVYAKLGAHDRAGAVATAMRLGVIS